MTATDLESAGDGGWMEFGCQRHLSASAARTVERPEKISDFAVVPARSYLSDEVEDKTTDAIEAARQIAVGFRAQNICANDTHVTHECSIEICVWSEV
jgi:hypothetical protein